MKRLRLSYANVMATIAVFIALGGSAYAATQLKKNSVGAKQIKNGSITPKKLSPKTTKALQGVSGTPGASGLAGKEGPRGPSDYYAFENHAEQIVDTAGETVSFLTLPAGEYLLTTNLVTESESADTLKCRVESGGTEVGAFQESVPGYTPLYLPFSKRLHLTGSSVVKVVCAAELHFFRDFSVSMLATQVGAIHEEVIGE